MHLCDEIQTLHEVIKNPGFYVKKAVTVSIKLGGILSITGYFFKKEMN